MEVNVNYLVLFSTFFLFDNFFAVPYHANVVQPALCHVYTAAYYISRKTFY